MTHSLLLIEDEPTLAKNIRAFLARYDFDVHVAESGEDGLERLDDVRPEAVILDFNLPGMNGLEVLRRVRERCPRTKVFMMTGQGSEQVAVDAMKAGAVDYFTKPVELNQLRRAMSHALAPATVRAVPAGDSGIGRLIGRSPAMEQLKERLARAVAAEAALVDADAPAVLVTGETGTGKELVARAIHFDGKRADKPFIEVNCSGIPANLLESELFGHERGAFTDAKEQKIGLIEAADGGTLFLDEIGELDLNAQAKLLKLLENKLVRRVGSVKERKVDVRIVAATNRDLQAESDAGRFRADLFFRLGIIRIETPPLRERGNDVVLLARHFLRTQAARYGKTRLLFDPAVDDALRAWSWPGNVRELRNVVEQAVVLAQGDVIGVADLAIGRGGHGAHVRAPHGDGAAAAGMDISQPIPVNVNLVQLEREVLARALEANAWNVTAAARSLGISRDTLRYRIEKFQLRLPS
jgi:DNA-binding NtrC family response regulator